MFNQNGKKLFVLIAVLVVVGVVVFAVFGGGKAKISLEASSDKPSYVSGEEIKLAVRLTNTGNKNTCVSDTALGNIKFLSVKRDGKPVETRTAPSYFITSLAEMIKSKLKQLAPGEKMEIALSSSEDPGLKAQALYTTALDKTSGLATFYGVQLPGTYQIELAYEYLGEPSADCSDVFRGITNTATVSFTVTK